MTRLWQPALPIQVHVIDDRPAYFVWGASRYQVHHLVQNWRIRIWWRNIWRHYYKLITHNGQTIMLVIIYCDLLEDAWYLQQVYD